MREEHPTAKARRVDEYAPLIDSRGKEACLGDG